MWKEGWEFGEITGIDVSHVTLHSIPIFYLTWLVCSIETALESQRQMGFHLHCGHLPAYSKWWPLLNCFFKPYFHCLVEIFETIYILIKIPIKWGHKAKWINWGKILRSNTNLLQTLGMYGFIKKKKKEEVSSAKEVSLTEFQQKNELWAQIL